MKLYWLYMYVTEFVKTDLMGTNTEIHFLSQCSPNLAAISYVCQYIRGRCCIFKLPKIGNFCLKVLVCLLNFNLINHMRTEGLL